MSGDLDDIGQRGSGGLQRGFDVVERLAGLLFDGARYSASSNAWTALPTSGAPSARQNHTAIFTNVEMIVWGGFGANGGQANGARYNRATDLWMPLPAAPIAGRGSHSAVWTGSDMIVWGGTGVGGLLGDGARYSVSTSGWTQLTNITPPGARQDHTAIWTGTEMLIWGGYGPNGALGDPLFKYHLPVTLYLYSHP